MSFHNRPVQLTESIARIAPQPMDALREDWLAILHRIPGDGLKGCGFPRNVLGTIMHNPDTLGPFLDCWVTSKLKLGLSVREQELVILRMACLFRAAYVWKHHVPVGREFGIDERELGAVHAADYASFNPRERALLALTDELIEERTVRAAVWAAHKPALSDRDMVDLVLLVSHYVFFALVNNAMQVQVEEGVAGERPLEP